MNPISTLRRHCDIAQHMMNQAISGQKPQLHRAPASDSTASQQSVASDASLNSEDRMERASVWGYIYAAATFAKPDSRMSAAEKQFAKEVDKQLRLNTPPRALVNWDDVPPTRQETIQAQMAQWRAEDEARAAASLRSWDEF